MNNKVNLGIIQLIVATLIFSTIFTIHDIWLLCINVILGIFNFLYGIYNLIKNQD